MEISVEIVRNRLKKMMKQNLKQPINADKSLTNNFAIPDNENCIFIEEDPPHSEKVSKKYM